MSMLLLLQFLCLFPDFTWQELLPRNRCGDPLVLWSIVLVRGQKPFSERETRGL